MDEIYTIADKQGWSDATLLRLSLDFIQSNANLAAFVERLQQVADEENNTE